MPKMKTKSGAKKRFKITGRGKVRNKPAFTGHLMMNKPQSMKRKARDMRVLADSQAKHIKDNWLPYQRSKGNNKRKKQGGQS